LIVFLTEKESAAKKFSKAFGGMTGTYKGNKYKIVHASGHLYEYDSKASNLVAKELKSKYGWKLDTLPWDKDEISWKRSKKYKQANKIKSLKEELNKADEIIIATDIDSSGEGDLIAYEVLIETKIPVEKKKITRMRQTGESVVELQTAFDERKEIKDFYNNPDYQKAVFRTKWDYLSMQFTVIASKLAPSKMTLRQGRLKSTMVKLIGDQEKLVDNYEAIPYYQPRFKDENGIVYTNPKSKKWDKKEDVPIKDLHDSNVILDKKEKKSSPPPQLIDLLGIAGRLSGYSTKTITNTYQKMYQDEVVSYPRTDDKKITLEQFNEFLKIADDVADVVGVDKSLLTYKKPRKTHIHKSGAHGANRPDHNVPKSLKDLDKYGSGARAIYTLLARNSLAMLCEDYIYERYTGHIEDFPEYKGGTNVPVSLGWKEIYQSDEEDEDISKGLGKIGKPFVFEGFPPKPKNPTVTFIKNQLEKYDVGTGATRTETITQITDTNHKYPLATNKKGKLSLTDYGKVSYALIQDSHIADVKTSETVIQTMRDISNGDIKKANKVLDDISKLVENDLKIMKKNSSNIDYEKPVYEKKEKVKGIFKGKEIEINRKWGQYEFSDEEIEKLFNGEKIILKGLTSKKGKPYSVEGQLQKQKYRGKTFYGFKSLGFVND
jgi:DNA topoisomerase